MGRLETLGAALRHLPAQGLNALLPPRCLGCARAVDRTGVLCATCWAEITFIAPPQCACCGYPFAYESGVDSQCSACLRDPPPFHRARAVMVYDQASKGLLLGLKHGDRTEAAPAYGDWLARGAAELVDDVDLVVPVPLHWIRLFRRRYNQSALLGAALARRIGQPIVPDLLVRRRNSPPQGRLSPAARHRNVAGAFRVHPAHKATLEGRRVLLVDDVMTTGATATACANVLLRGGAAAVEVLVLARVMRPRRPD